MFQYESLRLSCEVQGNFTVKRRVSFSENISDWGSECSSDWGQINTSQCVIDDLYAEDSGAYWCGSAQGTCRHDFNITVTGRAHLTHLDLGALALNLNLNHYFYHLTVEK